MFKRAELGLTSAGIGGHVLLHGGAQRPAVGDHRGQNGRLTAAQQELGLLQIQLYPGLLAPLIKHLSRRQIGTGRIDKRQHLLSGKRHMNTGLIPLAVIPVGHARGAG